MRICLVFLLSLAAILAAKADQKISEVQQNLKDQGFYYGDVNGETNKETTDAVRRYQIRNGLAVTGELDDQTIQAIRKTQASEQAGATPVPQASVPAPAVSAAPREINQDREAQPQPPPQSFDAGPASPPVERQEDVYDARPGPGMSAFARTPYETAPPELQSKVIASAQKILSQRGLYKYPVDGLFSPNLEFSLRAYQARVGLPPTGRLDLETLAAMELLPGSHRRPVARPRFIPSNRPPVRGEWIRP